MKAVLNLDSTGGLFLLSASPRDKDRVKAVPGARYDRQLDCWTLPVSWAAGVGLSAEFGADLEMSAEVRAWAVQEKALLSTLLAMKVQDYPEAEGPLFPYQHTGEAWLASCGQALLTDEPGLGKTLQVLKAIEDIGADAFPALVICPQTVKHNWAAEIGMWLPGTTVQVIGGTPAQKKKQFEAAAGKQVTVINWQSVWRHTRLAKYGSVAMTEDERTEKELNAIPFRTVIADEGHRGVDPKAKQTRGWTYLAHQAEFRYALTGTPVVNKPADLWSILHALRPQDFPEPRSRWIERFCNAGQGMYGWEVWGLKESAKAELFSFLDPRMLRRTKAEVLPQLPPKQFQTRWVEMEGKQATVYKALKKEMLAEIGGEILTVSSPLVLVGRLTQAAAGTPVLETRDIIDQNGDATTVTEVVALSNPSCKVAALLDIIDERPGEHLVVFAASRKLIELCAEVLASKKVSHILLTGEVSGEQRQANVETFQAGEAQIALCTIGASSEGITLTRARTAVFLQRAWSNVANLQAQDRIHRIGQSEQVTIIDVVTYDSIESAVHAKGAEKDAHLQEVLRDALR